MPDPPLPIKKEESGEVQLPPADEEDLDEDAGDLEFFEKGAQGAESLYLARLPRSTWKAWVQLTERLGDDDEIRIGTIRTWNEPTPQGPGNSDGAQGQVTKLRMLLDASCPEHQMVPREYDLEVTENGVNNHFMFCEADLPSFKARNKAKQAAVSAGIPASLLRQKNGEPGEKRTYDRRSRYQPYYRKAIPKKTKIIGKIRHDVRVEPRNAQEEEKLLQQQMRDLEQSKTKLKIISRNAASSTINPGTAGAATWAGSFIKHNPPAKPKKGEHIKAARVAKNELLDMLFACFRDYKYWSMKALRQRTQQPDSYLRSVLEECAVLQKSGRFANTYCLSDAYADDTFNQSKEAEAEAGEDEDEDEDEDDGQEMEDVIPTN